MGRAWQIHRSGIKTEKGGKYEDQHKIEWERYVHIACKKGKLAGICALRTKDTQYSRVELNQVGRN
jgi:hypothetical protein